MMFLRVNNEREREQKKKTMPLKMWLKCENYCTETDLFQWDVITILYGINLSQYRNTYQGYRCLIRFLPQTMSN